MHVGNEPAKNLPNAEEGAAQAVDDHRSNYGEYASFDDRIKQGREGVEIRFVR